MKSSGVECSASSSSPAESFVFKVRNLTWLSLENKSGTRQRANKGKETRRSIRWLDSGRLTSNSPLSSKKKTSPPPSNLKASLAALAAAPPNLLFALASHADEAAAVDAGGGFKVTPLEILIVMAPVAFYALLSAYRSLVNPKASIGDGLFIVAALVIVANVVSILAFHKRIY